MSKNKSKKEITKHKDKSLEILDKYMTNLIETDKKKADLLAYWLHTYTNYLKFEDTFEPKKNKRYERGDIIQVNLGFNIGSEHGGLHYAVVLDNNNAHSSPVITVIPLSSSNGENIRSNEVYLGDDIYQKMKNKISGITQVYEKQMENLNDFKYLLESVMESLMDSINENNINSDEIGQRIALTQNKLDFFIKQQEDVLQKKAELNKMSQEIKKMTRGSVALVNQITTISKIRIVDPKHNHGVLNGIKLSPQNLDNINNKMQQLFIKNT